MARADVWSATMKRGSIRQSGTWLRRSAGLACAGALAVCSFQLPAMAAPNPQLALKARDAANALVGGNPSLAVDLYTEALSDAEISSDRRATLLNDRGVAYVRLSRTREALKDYNQAVELFPEYAAVYNNRGNLLLALGFDDEALKDFNRAVALAPGYAAAYNNRAGVLMKLGKAERAVEDFTRAVKLIPTSPAPLSGRGRAHLMEGRPHAAIRDFSRAVQGNERFAEGYRARAEAKLEVGQYAEAIEDLSRAVAFEPNQPNHFLLRGHAYLATEDTKSAIADFTRVIELAPQNAAGYEARGLASAMAGDIEVALGDLNGAISLNPRSASAFAYRAYAYTRSGQPAIAARDLETATKLDSENAEVYWAGAELAAAESQTEEAVKKLRLALLHKPGFKRATDTLARLGFRPALDRDEPIADAGRDGWQVVTRNRQFFALNAEFPELRVPLEMMGSGEPKILSFESREEPYDKFGVLYFSAGEGKADDGSPIPYEQAAVIDKSKGTVLAIEPHRAGEKFSEWTWGDDGRVNVASIDGFNDELPIAVGIVAAAQAAAKARAEARARADRRRYSDGPEWAPWGNGWGEQQGQRQGSRRKKQKSFFQLLFGG